MKKVGIVFVGLFLLSDVVIAQPADSNDSPFATNPQPASGEIVSNTWTTLRWQPGNSATMHQLYVSDEGIEKLVTLSADLNSDCVVDFRDLEIMAGDWLAGGPALAADLNADSMVDSKDYAVLAGQWLDEQLSPTTTTDAFQVVGSLGTPIPSGLVADTTYYWRVDEVNEAHPDSPWKGEVWEFTVAPFTAWGPVPADTGKLMVGAGDVQLSWNAGLGAIVHYVHFSENFEDANNANVQEGTVTMKTTFNPGQLDPGKTYYWRIDEFDGDNRVFHQGAVWSFSTTQWIVVDNFEQYTETEPSRIWEAWEDGFETNGTGALVGHLEAHNKPHTYETTIVHSGRKSMPLYYDNSGEPDYPVEFNYGTRLMYSEATLPFDPVANWSRQGDLTVTTLVLWFRGLEDNASESLSVAIKDSTGGSVVVPLDSDMLQSTEWHRWQINLAELAPGIDLTRISSLTIRIGQVGNTTPGGAGLLYVDDIGLSAE